MWDGKRTGELVKIITNLSHNSRNLYSPPASVINSLTVVWYWFLTNVRKESITSDTSDFFQRRLIQVKLSRKVMKNLYWWYDNTGSSFKSKWTRTKGLVAQLWELGNTLRCILPWAQPWQIGKSIRIRIPLGNLHVFLETCFSMSWDGWPIWQWIRS